MKRIAWVILAASVLLLGPVLPSEAASSGRSSGARSSGGSHAVRSYGGSHAVRSHGYYHGGGSHGYYRGGVWIGAPYWGWGLGWGPGWWGYPRYGYGYPGYGYYNSPVVVEREAPVYVQPEAQPQYWYYCQAPQGYYPYVQQCPGGWQKVLPTPPPAQ